MLFCSGRCCVILEYSLSIQNSPKLSIIPVKAYLSSGEIIRWRESVDIGPPNSLKPPNNEPLKNLFFVSFVNKFNVPWNLQENWQAFDMRNQSLGLPSFLAVVGLLVHHIFPFETENLPTLEIILLFQKFFLLAVVSNYFGDRLFLTVNVLN